MKFIIKATFILIIGLLSASISTLFAQGTQASISGTVVDEKGETVIGAAVQIRNLSTGFTSSTMTSDNGEYIFKQVPLGSPYTVTVSYLGYGNQVKSGYSLNRGDLLRVDFKLQVNEVEIQVVEIVAHSLKNTIPNTGASTSITSKYIEKMPVNGRNFTSLIDLSPLSAGSNLSGQIATSTNYTVDGMTGRGPTSGGSTNRGPYSISMEAIREFEVATNQYDVTYGRSGGGTIGTVTKSGTNTFGGSVFTYMRTDWLASKYNAAGNRRSDEYSIYQYGFSLGGPIIKDRLHFFAAWDHQKDSRPFYIADIKSEEDENTYNVTQVTLDKYLNIARSKYGVSNSPQFGSFDKKRGTDALFARVDWQINATNLLTLRNNFVRDKNNRGVGDNSKINLYEVYGTHLSKDNSLMANLRSVLSPKVVNELKGQWLYTLDHGTPNTQLPSDNIPRAIVEKVESTLSDGKNVNTTIQLGGQRYLPEKFKNHVFQLVDNVYYNSGNMNYTLGADLMFTKMSSLITSELNGRFYFNGMDDFENLKPYRYAREVSLVDDLTVTQDVLTSAVYAQLQTKPIPGLEVMAGIRAELTNYFKKPAFNQIVYDELGLKTNHGVNGFQIQPRIQLTWDINEKRTDIIRLGGGIFGSSLNNYSMINNLLNDGTKVAAVDIQGANVPVPDFELYRKDPSKAPGVELFDLPGVERVSTINMNSKDVKVPVVYKANLSYTHFFSDRLKVTGSLFGTWTRNNYFYIDKNMSATPFFTLDKEGGRGVYVPASTISTKGSTDWMKGRVTDKIGRALELISKGKVNQYAFVLDAVYRYCKDGEVSMSYTWNDSKDNTSYNGNVANSSTLYQMIKSDPRDLSCMSYSDNQFRHKIVFFGTLPGFYGFNVGIRFSGIGGRRYSVVVNGNINGDFVTGNDLAYIFDIKDPNTPIDIKNGIQEILDNPDVNKSMKTYIRDNMGKVADRNGGVNGFYGVCDIRVTKKIKIHKTQNIEFSADLFNVANLLNKKWGIDESLGKQSIYTVTGFNATQKEYIYKVNPNAGVPVKSGDPFRVQLGVRYAF